MWVNVKRAETARGAYVGGQQMYVEYMVPAQVRRPFPIVLVHGGGGQGTDWMGTPDGRPGWFQYLVQEGYKVYVVDRPGHGRSPLHPDLHGGFPANHITLESLAGRFTPPAANPAQVPNEYQKNHTQWPGPGNVGSTDLDQLVAGLGGSYVQTPPPPGRPQAGRAARLGARAGGAGGRGNAPAGPPQPANAGPAGALNAQHLAWRQAGADLLDKIGPAIIMTHSAGGPFGLLVAEARPNAREGDGDHRRRRLGLRGWQPLGHVERAGHLRSAGRGPVRDQDDLRRQPGAWRCRLLPAGRAGAQAAESEEHEGGLRHRRLVVRVAGQSRRRRVPEAGRRAGRGDCASARSASRATAT